MEPAYFALFVLKIIPVPGLLVEFFLSMGLGWVGLGGTSIYLRWFPFRERNYQVKYLCLFVCVCVHVYYYHHYHYYYLRIVGQVALSGFYSIGDSLHTRHINHIIYRFLWIRFGWVFL